MGKDWARKHAKFCKVGGCSTSTKNGDHGYCQKHAQRVRRYGDPHYVTTEAERRRLSRLSQPSLGKGTSYKKFMGQHEHRAVMEKSIGRKLGPDEIVHHKDGNRLNNSLTNLELTTRREHAREHGMVKLVEEDIPVIRDLIAMGWSQQAIGDEFGVTQGAIGAIHRGVTWRDV